MQSLLPAQQRHSMVSSKLGLVITLMLLMEAVGSCHALYVSNKRVSGMRLQDCIDDHDVKRSDGLNFYLSGLAKCVASVGRPRFGKRSDKSDADNLATDIDAAVIRQVLEERLRDQVQSQMATHPTHFPWGHVRRNNQG